MPKDFKDSIRSRMGAPASEGGLQQTVEVGLFGVADASTVTDIVRNTFPRAIVGGVTNESIDGGVLRVGTGQERVFLDEIEEMQEDLGEDRVSQSAFGISTRRFDGTEDEKVYSVDQSVTVRVNNIRELLRKGGDDFKPLIREALTEDGWPPGALSPKFHDDDIRDILIRPQATEVEVKTAESSVDGGKIHAIRSKIKSGLRKAVSTRNELDWELDEVRRFEEDMSDFEVREIEVAFEE